ncbi:DUF4232 domain-containing protein [Kitasatospora sp. NPDC101183]|uniref:DUF4232 domain-containing protein n=1 Tax=Kitasatospora sp. NPDC101183 TaxID=3364100 RepID=UPI0038155DFC
MRTALRARAAVLGGGVLLLSAVLTGCNDDSTSAAPPSAPSAPSAPSVPSSSPAASPTGTTSSAPAPAPTAAADCLLTDLTFGLKEASSAVLLTATNKGTAPCALHRAPVVSDPVAGHDLAVAEGGKPPAAVVLAPGRTAYAAITMGQRESTQNHRAKTVNIALVGKDGGGTDGHVAVESPGPGGLAINPSTRIGYWRAAEGEALS